MKLLGAETIPPQLSTFLLNKSEGNPFYCLEIMAFLQRKGFVRVAADRRAVEMLKGGSEMERDFNVQFESMGVHRLLMAQAAGYPLPTSLPPTTYHLPPTTYHLLPATCYLLPTAHCPLPTAHYPPEYPPPTPYSLLPTTRYPLSTHALLLTASLWRRWSPCPARRRRRRPTSSKSSSPPPRWASPSPPDTCATCTPCSRCSQSPPRCATTPAGYTRCIPVREGLHTMQPRYTRYSPVRLALPPCVRGATTVCARGYHHSARGGCHRVRGCLRVRQVDANLGKLRELHQLEFNSEQLSYSFRSSLMRDVIYTSMTYENRKALHTAAADLLLQGGKSSHTKYLAAYYHLRQAEDEPRVLRLTTDAAQQAPAPASS